MSVPHRPQKHGFTLVELLVAMLIAGVVIGATLTLYRTVFSMRRTQAALDQGVRTATMVLADELAALRTAAPIGSNSCQVVFEKNRIEYCSLQQPLAMRHVLRVEDGVLESIRRPLVGPAGGVTNQLLRGVERLDVRTCDGDEDWTETWPASGKLPAAVELKLELKSGAQVQRQSWVPAGRQIESSFERGG